MNIDFARRLIND